MKVTTKAWICALQDSPSDKPYFTSMNFDPTKIKTTSNWVVIRAVEYVEEIPDDLDIRADIVEGLKRDMQKARADFEANITRIKRQINDWTAISCEPAP